MRRTPPERASGLLGHSLKCMRGGEGSRAERPVRVTRYGTECYHRPDSPGQQDGKASQGDMGQY